MNANNMPSMRSIRRALRDKYGIRAYRIGNTGDMHARTDTGWRFVGWIDDPMHLASLSIGPLSLSAADFKGV